MNANLKPATDEEVERLKLLREAVEEGIQDIRQGRASPLDIKKTIQRAIENSRQGRKVNPLVTPDDR